MTTALTKFYLYYRYLSKCKEQPNIKYRDALVLVNLIEELNLETMVEEIEPDMYNCFMFQFRKVSLLKRLFEGMLALDEYEKSK